MESQLWLYVDNAQPTPMVRRSARHLSIPVRPTAYYQTSAGYNLMAGDTRKMYFSAQVFYMRSGSQTLPIVVA